MDHYTTLPGVPTKSDLVPGMAHFRGTGPSATYCSTCSEFVPGKEVRVKETSGKCKAFKRMIGKWGPPFDRQTPSCKYYKARE